VKALTVFVVPVFLFFLVSCATSAPKANFQVEKSSVQPGSSVLAGKEKIDLYKGSFKIGDSFAKLTKGTDVQLTNAVSVINVVPSVDTPVCEEQTHSLGENSVLDKRVSRLTISRDLPMAQQRFAKEAKLTNIVYYSDYKQGSFGKNSGLLMKGKELLARAVIVTDQNNIIRYFQIVPDVSHLPDMDEAYRVANSLLPRP